MGRFINQSLDDHLARIVENDETENKCEENYIPVTTYERLVTGPNPTKPGPSLHYCHFFFFGLGAGNSFNDILTNSLNHSLSSILSSIKKLGFAPSYGGASTTFPINFRPEFVGLINSLLSHISPNSFSSE